MLGFSRKSNEDEFSRKSNGGWVFLGIKRGLQNNNNNNNIIRLVPVRIESGRGKYGLLGILSAGGQLQKRASFRKGLLDARSEKGGILNFIFSRDKKKLTNHENNFISI